MKQYLWSNLVLGEDSLYEFLKTHPFHKTAFVISSHIKNNPYFNKVLDEVCLNRDYKIVLEVQRETNQSDIDGVIEELISYAPDGIVAIGGGSVLDASKLLKIFYELPETTWEDAKQYYQLKQFPGKATLVAVPTTTGTGSEMTGCAMFVGENNQKGMFLDNQIIPDVAILDYRLVAFIPRNTLIYSTVDALTHAIEAATNQSSDLVTQFLSLQSINSILTFLNKAVNDKDEMANRELSVSSLFAGISINNGGVGLAHSLNYPGEDYHLPHGLITGMLTPYCLQLSEPHSIYDRILGQMGIVVGSNESAEKLANYLFEYYRSINMPTSLNELGIDEEDYLSKVDGYVSRFMVENASYFMGHQTYCG